MVLDCFTKAQSDLCPFSSSSDVFYSPFPHPFPTQTHGGTSPTNSGQTGAQGTTRMLPRLCEPPVIVLGGSRVSCRGSGLGQRKSALHVSQKGPLPPSRSFWHARQRHSRIPVTAGSASLRAWRGFLHSTTVALHTQPSSCAEMSPGITSAQPFLLTPVMSGSHRLLCTVPDSCCTAGPGGTILKFPFILM